MPSARNQNSSSSGQTKRGIFDQAPEQTLVLLLDFKSTPEDLLVKVQSAIASFRQSDYLSYWDGRRFVSRPITLVLTGDAVQDSLVQETASSTHRDIFFDAPLAHLGDAELGSIQHWNQSNAYYASTSFASSVGTLHAGRLSSQQLKALRGQVRAAKDRGLKVRYWNTPSWPTSLRNHVWQILLEEGSDMLNVDDLQAAAFLDWRKVKHSWFNG